MKRILVTVAVLGCLAALAAHALTRTAHAKSTSTSPAFAQAEKFTACMRSHGIKNFPEPTSVDGQIYYSGPPGIGREPGFRSDSKTCAHLLGLKYTTGSKSG